MSLRSAVNSFIDKSVDGRFGTDSLGRLNFYPFGFGMGRIVPDAQSERDLRRASRLMVYAVAVLVIIIAIPSGAVVRMGTLPFLGYIVACAALGFATQLYPLWVARHLPRSNEKRSYVQASMQSLDRFGMGFLIFGLVTCALFAVVGALMLAFGSYLDGANQVSAIVLLLIFGPLTFLYIGAIAKRRRTRT